MTPLLDWLRDVRAGWNAYRGRRVLRASLRTHQVALAVQKDGAELTDKMAQTVSPPLNMMRGGN